ncbi:glyoxalase/bleomycin resistance/dioxygenase family protein [bacterium 1xD8-6]|nr:glyoxalase/bleomycin resistance/dioxygenase family protein [bacterium D16-36]RKI65564.1 glyoxalase/bleomycin resistance/dioxygenase family protein [bacterium 1xD8-6]
MPQIKYRKLFFASYMDFQEGIAMITFGNIYIITKDFEAAVDFYKKLFERDVVAQNKSRYAIFQIDGLGLSIMNGKYDKQHPDEVESLGEPYSLYDDMNQIMDNTNCGKVVINICTDDLKKEYERIKALGLGSDLTEIRYINAGSPYWYFLLKDLDGNTIEITGDYNEIGDVQHK